MNDELKSDEENVEVLDENPNGVTNGSVAKENVVEATGDLNNKYFELKKNQKSFGNINKNSQKNSFIKFNLTKKYKIFQKFLSIGIDTSGLYTLDDEMNDFILNPKITYNFPFNNLESELE